LGDPFRDSDISPADAVIFFVSILNPQSASPANAIQLYFQPMKSFEVIKNAVDEPGVKAVAAALKVSPALVYKWCEPPAEQDDPEQSGAKNPLDRLREMYLLTKDIRLVRWLCHEAGGFFVSHPVADLRKPREETIFNETRAMVREFSELLDAVTESVEDDSMIDTREADVIRQKWEDLKACVERFVIGCERGHFGPKIPKGQTPAPNADRPATGK
jgi:hypothetical protein